MTASAAVAGAILARKFGRGPETDGFFAAYAVYVLLVLAATAFRIVVLPTLARAAQAGRLAAEVMGYALAFLIPGIATRVNQALATRLATTA